MNLIEEEFQNKEEKKKKASTKIVLIAIILVFIAIIAIASYLMYIQSTSLKIILNGQTNEKIKQLLWIQEDGTLYLPIKEIAKYFDYDSYNGEYTEKSETQSKCYVQNENEVANFSLSSNKIYKINLKDNSPNNYVYLYSKDPVKSHEGVLYASSEMIEKAFNVSIQYENNRISILTMPYLINAYSSKILDYGYTEISDVFDNQKAVLQNMLVVKKDDNKCAVIDTSGNKILEAKYDNITYIPNVGDFLVETNNKYGVLSKKGETKVKIMYDSISLMDSDAELYVVKKDNKYGVVDFKGNIKIYIENDEIGMDIDNFTDNNIKSKYILVDNLIPVRRDKLWGLYDKNGNKVVDFQYDSFGYVASSNKNALNLLVIPDYNVFVACKNKKYTLLNSVGKELLAPIADDIYMEIKDGKKNYYIAANNKIYDAEKYLDSQGVTAKEDSDEETNTSNNNSSNDNTNSSEEKD